MQELTITDTARRALRLSRHRHRHRHEQKDERHRRARRLAGSMRLAEAKRMVSQNAKIGPALRAVLQETENYTENIRFRMIFDNFWQKFGPSEHRTAPRGAH